MEIIRVDNLSYRVSGREILKKISFTAEEGDYLSIIGPNGAGKSTLLKHLNRIITPSDPETVFLRGKPLNQYTQKEIARHVCYVSQNPEHIEHFTVREFILMGRYPYLGPFSSPTSDDDRTVDESMELTGTGILADRDMMTLSGGELQKVYIAAGLAQGGDLLLLDEPATFLDPKHQHDIFLLLRKINETGKTVVSVTHDLNTAVLTGKRILALKDGEILFDGDSDEIMNKDLLKDIYEREFSFAPHPGFGGKIALPEVYR
jgi:iron complex transport system ATP-binding protein